MLTSLKCRYLYNTILGYLVSGNFDYLIKARVADMAAYREFLGETLLTLPGVQESTSYVVMEQVKETLALEVPY